MISVEYYLLSNNLFVQNITCINIHSCYETKCTTYFSREILLIYFGQYMLN